MREIYYNESKRNEEENPSDGCVRWKKRKRRQKELLIKARGKKKLIGEGRVFGPSCIGTSGCFSATIGQSRSHSPFSGNNSISTSTTTMIFSFDVSMGIWRLCFVECQPIVKWLSGQSIY